MADDTALQAIQDQIAQLQEQVTSLVQAASGKVDLIVQNATDTTTARDQVLPASAAAVAARDQVLPAAAVVAAQASDIANKYPTIVTASSTAQTAALIAQNAACDYWVDNAAGLAALTGMTANQKAFQRDTEHILKYSGSAWVDQGLAPTATKLNASQMYQTPSSPGPWVALATATGEGGKKALLIAHDRKGGVFARLNKASAVAMLQSIGAVPANLLDAWLRQKSVAATGAVSYISSGNKAALLSRDKLGRFDFQPSPRLASRIAALLPGVQPFDPVSAGLYSNTLVQCIGDSLTAGGGTSYPNYLSTLLGKPVINSGIGGQKTAEMAARCGGINPFITVTGGLVPASNATAVEVVCNMYDHAGVPTKVDFLFSSGSWSTTGMTGVIYGPDGTLLVAGNCYTATAASSQYLFKRTTSGSDIAIPEGSYFVLDSSLLHLDKTAIIMGGTNDIRVSDAGLANDTDGIADARRRQTIENIFKMVEARTARDPSVIVLNFWPGSTSTPGTEARKAIEEYDKLHKIAFGDRRLDIWDYMVNRAIFEALSLGWISTITATDRSYMSQGLPPPSLMSDVVHDNSIGQQLRAREIRRTLNRRFGI